MKDLFRETLFGNLVRLLSGGKYLAHDDVYDRKTIQGYKTAISESSSASDIKGSSVDPEKGKDARLVEWAQDDPHNPRNWSTPKKFFVTFEVCLLTTSVYIGNRLLRTLCAFSCCFSGYFGSIYRGLAPMWTKSHRLRRFRMVYNSTS